MILIVGAHCSGKLEYVKSLGYSSKDIADGCIDQRPVVYNLQKIVASNPTNAPELFEKLIKKEIVVCDEVGSGIVPASKENRDVREATGRLCNQLAKEATKVVRLVCGIPTVIKDDILKDDDAVKEK